MQLLSSKMTRVWFHLRSPEEFLATPSNDTNCKRKGWSRYQWAIQVGNIFEIALLRILFRWQTNWRQHQKLKDLPVYTWRTWRKEDINSTKSPINQRVGAKINDPSEWQNLYRQCFCSDDKISHQQTSDQKRILHWTDDEHEGRTILTD